VQHERPILITGMPRSGTTWVGRIISNAPSVGYVHEPFNITRGRCACGIYFDKWFYYINSENEERFHKHIEHVVGSSTNRFKLLNVVFDLRRTKSLRPAKTYIKQLWATRAVVKDPLAACSTAWMSSTFNMNAIVMVRHPAAVVSSYKKLGWSHPFSHFLAQPLLMRDYLNPFADEIREFVHGDPDIVDQAALLWKLIYYVLQKQSALHDEWIILRYENLSANVEAGFRALFQKLGLTLTNHVHHKIQKTNSVPYPRSSANPYSILRNSEKMIWRWKSLLSHDEIERVRVRVGDVANVYYSDDDW